MGGYQLAGDRTDVVVLAVVVAATVGKDATRDGGDGVEMLLISPVAVEATNC